MRNDGEITCQDLYRAKLISFRVFRMKHMNRGTSFVDRENESISGGEY